MRFVKPAIFMTFKSMPVNDEIYRWLKFIGCAEETARFFAYERAKTNTAAERGIELFGRRCYMSFEPGLNPNVTKIRENMADYLLNIMKSKHGSVLEHITFTFNIENLSRVCTAELNRHRAGVAISEGSMRYIRYNDIPIVDVESFIPLEEQPTNEEDLLNVRRSKTREIVAEVAGYIEVKYAELVDIWSSMLESGANFAGKKHITSMLRRIAPMGIATGGVWTFNVRALRHMITMRVSPAAEEEILMIGEMMLEMMQKEEPILFGDFYEGEDGHWKPEYEKV